MLTTNVGGIAEVVTDAFLGQLVRPRELDPNVAGLRELLSKPGERVRIRAYGEKFSWDRTAKAYFALLSASVERREKRI